MIAAALDISWVIPIGMGTLVLVGFMLGVVLTWVTHELGWWGHDDS